MSLINRIVQRNVPTNVPLGEQRRITFVNMASLSAAAVAVAFMPLYAVLGLLHTLLALSFMAIGGVVAYILNTKGYYKLAPYTGIVSLFLVVICFTLFYGLQSGTTNLLISIPGISILLFGIKDLKHIAISSISTLVCAFLLVYYSELFPALYPQSEAINAIFYYSSLFALGAFMTFLMLYFHANSMQDEAFLQGLINKEKELSQSLEAKANQLERSNNIANQLLGKVSDNEVKLNSVLESFDDIIVLIDKEYIVKNIWKSKRMKLHLSTEEILNRPIYDIFIGDYLKDATFMIDLTFLLQKSHYMEVFEKRNMKWYGLKTNYLEYNGEGHITVLIRYIDKMKRSELFIKESSELAKLGGWEYIFGKEKIVFTEGAERLLGLSLATYTSNIKTLFELFDNEDARRLKHAVWQLRSQEIPFNILVSFENKIDKVKKIFQITGQLEKNSKIFKRYKGYLQDVTEKNDALNEINRLNKFYQTILDGIPMDIGVMDANFKMVYINPRAIKDVEMRKWIIGKSIEEYAIKRGYQDKPHIAQRVYFQEIARNNKTPLEYEEVIETNEKNLYFNRGFMPIFNEKNELENLIAYGHNITVLKEIQLELEKVTQDALQAAKSKENFLSLMSHEIRTPLNAVIGLSNILAMDITEPGQAQTVATLNSSAQALLVLINDILDYNKIVSGHLQLNSDAIDFNKLLERSKDMFSFQAESKQIDFVVSSTCPKGILYVGDEGRLFQIIVNVLSNAIKFTPLQGQVNFAISCKPQTDHSCMVHMAIKDTGIGIAEENKKLVFNAFSQESEHIARKFGGTGLGLSICKQLIKEMGGTIDFESVVGEGTTFHIDLELPHFIQEAQPLEPLMRLVENDGASVIKVLVVEDNKVNQIVVCKFLDKWGMESEVANNGVEALELLNKNEYHLILMDLHMPLMDGYETSINIRKSESAYQQIPIIALTADIMGDVKRKIFASGMTAFVSKPFKPEELKDSIYAQITRKTVI